MANYRKIAESHPAIRIYLRARLWARQDGRLTYRPSLETPVVSTDRRGFRHSVFANQQIAVDPPPATGAYSAILGSSHVFGFGLPDNSCTFASRFAERLNQPVVNLSFPEANTDALFESAVQHLDWERLDQLILFPGGSFTRFCYTGRCSKKEGPPPMKVADTAPPPPADEEASAVDDLVTYQIESIGRLAAKCGEYGVRFHVANELTFFDKPDPNPAEQNSLLGHLPQGNEQSKRFGRQQLHIDAYRAGLFPALRRAGYHILDFGPADGPSYIDEFHYDAKSIIRLTDHLVAQMDDD